METGIFFQIMLNGLMLGITYALVSLGLSVVFSIMRIVNFAHGELYMIGGFIAYCFHSSLGVSFITTLIIVAVCLGILGVILERIIFRPFRFRGDLLGGFIISLGLAWVLRSLAAIAFGITNKSVPTPFPGTIPIGNVSYPIERIGVIVAGILLVLCLNLFLKYHKTGQAMRAVAQDNDAAILSGVNINSISMAGLALGSALAGVAGALLSPIFFVNPWIGEPLIMTAFVVIIIGGMGSIPGVLIASLILGFIESWCGFLFGVAVVNLIFFGALIMILLFKPNGLFGHEM